jgi:hypothetical protein
MAAQSNLAAKKSWWLAYFIFMLVAWVVASFLGGRDTINLVLGGFYGIGLVGLWGFVRAKAIGWRLLWVAYFLLVVSGALYSIGNLAFGPGAPWPTQLWLFVLLAVLVTFPQWLALWFYSFRSPDIWLARAA